MIIDHDRDAMVFCIIVCTCTSAYRAVYMVIGRGGRKRESNNFLFCFLKRNNDDLKFTIFFRRFLNYFMKTDTTAGRT